jgi:hypothetical protein
LNSERFSVILEGWRSFMPRRFLRYALPALVPLAAFLRCGGGDNTNADGGGPDGSTTDGPVIGPDGGPVPDGGGDGGPVVDVGDSVLMRNNHINRDGLYTQPTFTTAGIATLKRDSAFDGTISGNAYAQPLFFDKGPNGKSIVIATTENNQVTALDADTGAVVWQKTVGQNASASGAGCGNIGPLGITGTPAIDPVSRTIFLNAAIGPGNAISEHEIHALSVDDGTERPNFPVKASTASYQGTNFNPPLENERGALLWLNGNVYVTYGGHAGDCGQYHGWVLSVPYPAGGPIGAYAASIAPNTRAAGIWAVGGPASDGTDVFVTTGNTFGSQTWVGQEALLRLQPGAVFSNQTADYWAPHNWLTLDNGDTDIGGTGALLVDVPGATPSKLAVALGKNGYAYLIDRGNLGGIGASQNTDGVSNTHVNSGEIINAAASVTTSTGTWVVFHAHAGAGAGCKTGSGDLVALKISATAPPVVSVEWCASSQTQASPFITTSDGSNDAIVWEPGAHLLGWDVNTGNPVYTGTDALANVRKFNTGIAAKGHIYVAGDNKVYSFKP